MALNCLWLTEIVAAYIFTALTFGLLDAVWLIVMRDRLYKPEMGSLLAERAKLLPSMILLFVTGLTHFAVLPAMGSEAVSYASTNGGFLGFMCYTTYNVTNHSVMKFWSWKLASVDTVWGMFAAALSC